MGLTRLLKILLRSLKRLIWLFEGLIRPLKRLIRGGLGPRKDLQGKNTEKGFWEDSGEFWWVLVSSGGVLVGSGEFWWVLVSFGGFLRVLVDSGGF